MHHNPNPFTQLRNKLILISNKLEKIKEKNKGTRTEKELEQLMLFIAEEINKLP